MRVTIRSVLATAVRIQDDMSVVCLSYWSHTGCARYTKSERGYRDSFKTADSHVRTGRLGHSTPQKSSSKGSGGSSELTTRRSEPCSLRTRQAST